MENYKTSKGQEITFRYIRAEDAPHLVDFFFKLSPQSRYMRFQTNTESLTPSYVRKMAQQFTEIDPQTELALVAFSQGELMGVARYAKQKASDDFAECAIVLRDDYQKMGLGKYLLQLLGKEAKAKGIRYFVASVLASNDKMLALLRKWEVGKVEYQTLGSELEIKVYL